MQQALLKQARIQTIGQSCPLVGGSRDPGAGRSILRRE
jgi:hypothetical protein